MSLQLLAITTAQPIAYRKVKVSDNHNNSLTLPLGQRNAANCLAADRGDLRLSHYHNCHTATTSAARTAITRHSPLENNDIAGIH